MILLLEEMIGIKIKDTIPRRTEIVDSQTDLLELTEDTIYKGTELMIMMITLPTSLARVQSHPDTQEKDQKSHQNP
jgi:hypothetical protein